MKAGRTPFNRYAGPPRVGGKVGRNSSDPLRKLSQRWVLVWLPIDRVVEELRMLGWVGDAGDVETALAGATWAELRGQGADRQVRFRIPQEVPGDAGSYGRDDAE